MHEVVAKNQLSRACAGMQAQTAGRMPRRNRSVRRRQRLSGPKQEWLAIHTAFAARIHRAKWRGLHRTSLRHHGERVSHAQGDERSRAYCFRVHCAHVEALGHGSQDELGFGEREGVAYAGVDTGTER